MFDTISSEVDNKIKRTSELYYLLDLEEKADGLAVTLYNGSIRLLSAWERKHSRLPKSTIFITIQMTKNVKNKNHFKQYTSSSNPQ